MHEQKMDLVRLLNKEDQDKTDEELLLTKLVLAERNAQEAMNIVYKINGVKRSLWYRMVLGRAQSILMSLLVRELGRR